ncbi:MAG TPA: response regulator [Polyangia bacterium]|nr:response regulator [Polyangia bacterium]
MESQHGDDSAAGGGCRCILVVEDDADIRASLQDLLEDEDYRIHVADNGESALGLLKDVERPCLVLLDLMMPHMSGAEFLTVLREREPLEDFTVLIVSAWPKEAEKLRLGAQGYVKKPFDTEVLLALVEKYCRRP